MEQVHSSKAFSFSNSVPQVSRQGVCKKLSGVTAATAEPNQRDIPRYIVPRSAIKKKIRVLGEGRNVAITQEIGWALDYFGRQHVTATASSVLFFHLPFTYQATYFPTCKFSCFCSSCSLLSSARGGNKRKQLCGVLVFRPPQCQKGH